MGKGRTAKAQAEGGRGDWLGGGNQALALAFPDGYLPRGMVVGVSCVCDIKTGLGVSGSILDVDFPPQGRTDGLQGRFSWSAFSSSSLYTVGTNVDAGQGRGGNVEDAVLVHGLFAVDLAAGRERGIAGRFMMMMT
jgi:hypothetical protein